MAKCNYEKKAEVLRSGVCRIVKNYDLQSSNTDFLTSLDNDEQYAKALWQYGLDFIKEARRINKASYKRTTRLRSRIKEYMAKGQCLFLTLTFTDDTLNRTNEATRKKYVKNYLKSVSDYYVANIDYGGKKGREHYHAVVVAETINYSAWHTYGAIKGEKVRLNDDSVARLPKYINKLTNHAIKDTTKQVNIIYSREIKQ